MREWVAQEDDFVLKQAKKKAAIRVKEGRAKPIDWLAVTLRVVDPTRDPIDDEIKDSDLDFVDPDGVFDGLSEQQLSELGKDIDTYVHLEMHKRNREYWRAMQIICKDKKRWLRAVGPEGRAVSAVSSDIDRLLAPKSYEELETLETQIRAKLDSDEAIDADYWQQLLDSLLVWKARAKLKNVYQAVIDSQMADLKRKNEQEAMQAQEKLVDVLSTRGQEQFSTARPLKTADPDPLLQLQPRDKTLEMIDETAFLSGISNERRKILRIRYVPSRPAPSQKPALSTTKPSHHVSGTTPGARFESMPTDDFSQATKALYDKEVARGVGEDEEIFTGEEEVETKNKNLWMGKYRPRKPKYFNRVQMGYEWNKYNQTHYDHDNPPPKVVQGYKFHIFYPDLIDKTKAPTYRIEREGGRKKGQSSAPAGEEDTCIIRFDSGPPYESIAFRIVDRDWDYSAKHDRGFKSTFEKGILTLHFSFKKIYYRK
jgi:Conserved mid region of cactin/Cactus-binding C-terminus of cactin protein